MVTAISLDPGRTTGYALGCKDETGYFVACGQERMDHRELWEFIPAMIEFVICEDFDYRPFQSDADLYPCELIGVIKLWTQGPMFRASDIESLHMQKPSVQGAKNVYYSDKKLKEMGVYEASYEHGRSAMKHLLYWFHFGKGFQFDIPGQQPELVSFDWLKRKAGLLAAV